MQKRNKGVRGLGEMPWLGLEWGEHDWGLSAAGTGDGSGWAGLCGGIRGSAGITFLSCR